MFITQKKGLSTYQNSTGEYCNDYSQTWLMYIAQGSELNALNVNVNIVLCSLIHSCRAHQQSHFECNKISSDKPQPMLRINMYFRSYMWQRTSDTSNVSVHLMSVSAGVSSMLTGGPCGTTDDRCYRPWGHMSHRRVPEAPAYGVDTWQQHARSKPNLRGTAKCKSPEEIFRRHLAFIGVRITSKCHSEVTNVSGQI